MSIKTWKAEFYSRPLKKFTKVQAIEHSLRKWIGLRPENREKHLASIYMFSWLRDYKGELFEIDSVSCALCVKYHQDYDSEFEVSRCETCPLYQSLGVPCDDREGDIDQPWVLWVDKADPEPMISALQKCLEENKSG